MASNVLVDKENLLRYVVGASWALYVLAFVQFSPEYLIQWVFAGVACLGVAAALLAILRVRFWKGVSAAVTVLLLFVYIDYWMWITEMATSSKPELGSPLALSHIVKQGWSIFLHHLANGAVLGGLKVLYFELLMPLVQLFILLTLAIQMPNKTPSTKG